MDPQAGRCSPARTTPYAGPWHRFGSISTNPKLFEYRGRPLVLLTATEHYGAWLNRPFRIERYLRTAAANGMTLTRLFTLFRELQTPINPPSTCKPTSPEFIAPFARTGPGFAMDGELRFNLDRDDPEFYERLHRFLGTAEELGVVVEVVLLSNYLRRSGLAVESAAHRKQRQRAAGLPRLRAPEQAPP